MSTPHSLSDVNRLDRNAFVSLLGEVFEHSPWVAEQALSAAPFDTIASLHAAMMKALGAASKEAQLIFLNAHPELAGAEARAHQLTSDSTKEQGSAGLDQLSSQQAAEFDRLNAAYRAKFGFPFIIAVRGRGKDEILRAFNARLAHDAATEEPAAFAEIAAITRMRLDRLVTP